MLTLVARIAGLLGGLLWVVRFVADLDALHWPGLVLLAVAGAGAGAGLVSSSATWLQIIVAVALPVLAWSVLEVLHDAGDPAALDAIAGGAVVLVCLVGLVGSRRGGEPPETAQGRTPHKPGKPGRHSGSHSASHSGSGSHSA